MDGRGGGWVRMDWKKKYVKIAGRMRMFKGAWVGKNWQVWTSRHTNIFLLFEFLQTSKLASDVISFMKVWKRYQLNEECIPMPRTEEDVKVSQSAGTILNKAPIQYIWNTSEHTTFRKRSRWWWWQNQLTPSFVCQDITLQTYNIITLLSDKKIAKDCIIFSKNDHFL